MSLYHKLGRACLKVTNGIKDVKARKNFRAERKIKRTGNKIKVGFIGQYLPSWGKIEPVYRIMKESDDFETYLICLPMGIHDYKLDDPEDESNDTYEYFTNQGYDAVNALVGKNQWLDLKSLELDYLFYTRPYNNYMPKAYSSFSVSKYTKVCVLLYAYTLLEDTYHSTLNEDFFRSVYLYFAECDYPMRKNIGHFRRSHKKGLQHSICLGMAGLDDIIKAKELEAPAWDFSSNEFRVMWTPRWTTDKAMGGSNFFTYKDSLVEFAENNKDIDFLFRPHPLMFDNFLNTGEMTQDEVNEYKNKIKELGNVSLDKEKEYGATFWKSSVLLSDISGMMYEYFLTGKPVIYCASNVELELAENSKELVKGCYVSNSEEETFDILMKLKNGEDPLKSTRRKLIKQIFGDDIGSIPANVVDAIRKDAKR